MADPHDRFSESAGAYVLHALEPAEREAFETHLATCAVCAEEVATLHQVAQGLARVTPVIDPPDSLRDRVLGQIGAPRTVQVRRLDVRDPRQAPIRRAPIAPWLAAAAALVIAAGAGVYARGLQERIEALEQGLRNALSRATGAEREIVGLRTAATDAQFTIGILAAPDLARIEMQGQPAAPRARARAFWSRSRGLVVTATDLPPVPAGRTYQLWVVTSGAPISAGLLEPDASGRVSAVIQTPTDLPTPVAMAVTLEPAGGVPAPTGERFLVGVPSTAL